jgi:signal transduction histidine kinase
MAHFMLYARRMEITANCPLAFELAARIRSHHADLTRRWLDRIAARVSLEPNRVFPSEQLLDHVHILMLGIADYLENPADEIGADMPVIAKAMELGALRLEQGFDAHEILKEYEILGGVLFSFAATQVSEMSVPCPDAEVLTFSHRLFRAISVIEQVTTSQYLRTLSEKVNEREEQLRRFNRMVSHELKNKVGAVLGAGELVQEEWVTPEDRTKFVKIVLKNARELQQVLEDLTSLSRLDSDTRRQRNVMLPEAVAEVMRAQREVIRSREVRIEVDPNLPRVEVNAPVVELCLSNYLSNAVKYSRPDAESWVRLNAGVEELEDGESALVVRVQDNGMGVPEPQREKLFERFFRADSTANDIEGTGLGLSLVRETVEAIGGRAWAEFDPETTTFLFSVPCRRRSEPMSSRRIFGGSRELAAS